MVENIPYNLLINLINASLLQQCIYIRRHPQVHERITLPTPTSFLRTSWMLSLSRLSYFGRNSATHAACFSPSHWKKCLFLQNIFLPEVPILSFNLAGSTASPITSINLIFSFLIWWYSACGWYTKRMLISSNVISKWDPVQTYLRICGRSVW